MAQRILELFGEEMTPQKQLRFEAWLRSRGVTSEHVDQAELGQEDPRHSAASFFDAAAAWTMPE